MTHRTSVAMTGDVEEALMARLVRPDRQEDLCLATYRPSTGASRATALIRAVIPPNRGSGTFTGTRPLPPTTSFGPRGSRKRTAAGSFCFTVTPEGAAGNR